MAKIETLERRAKQAQMMEITNSVGVSPLPDAVKASKGGWPYLKRRHPKNVKDSSLSRTVFIESGGDLVFRAVSSQVPLAQRGLTAVFGMGTGGTLSL